MEGLLMVVASMNDCASEAPVIYQPTVRDSFRGGKVVESADDAIVLLRAQLRDEDYEQENFLVLCLDARSRVLGCGVIHKGTATATIIHPREVFRFALRFSTSTVIIAHNHPSNDLGASDDDARMQARLCEAGELLGIPVVDSIIFSLHGHRSCIYR